MSIYPIYDSHQERAIVQMAPDAAFQACVDAMEKIGSVTVKKVGALRASGSPFGDWSDTLHARPRIRDADDRRRARRG